MSILKLAKRTLPSSITSYVSDISVRLSNCEKAIEMILDEKKMGFDSANAFNSQIGRREIFQEIMSSISPNVILETGTWTGETTAFMAGTNKPVLSCESNKTAHLLAVKRHSKNANVELFLQDSRDFIFSQVSNKSQDIVFFIYLDAHWHIDLPLIKELKVISEHSSNFVVMIDDFKVETDDGYRFDDYGNYKLDLDLIRQPIKKFKLAVFFPSISSNDETGARKGCVILASGQDVIKKMHNVSSLKEYKITK